MGAPGNSVAKTRASASLEDIWESFWVAAFRRDGGLPLPFPLFGVCPGGGGGVSVLAPGVPGGAGSGLPGCTGSILKFALAGAPGWW